jgi:hypothetical protein
MRFLLVVFAGCGFVCSSAFALEMPARKPGLWQLRIEFAGRKLPAQTVKQCIDAASDKLMNSSYTGGVSCSKQDVSHSGATMTIDTVCRSGPATNTSHVVVNGSFDSGYTMDVTSTRTGGPPVPGLPPGGAMHTTITAKWLGPCAAGMRPGDMIMANGMKMNMLDMQKRMPHKP